MSSVVYSTGKMISICFYYFFIVNFMISIKKRESKFFAMLFYIVLLLVYAGNIRTGFSDLTHYRIRYLEGINSDFFSDSGYVFFADLFSKMGISFNVFLTVIFLISSACIYYVCKKVKINYNLVLCLYSLFYLFFHMEGIRFFLGASFMTLAFYHLSQGSKKWYLLICIIATLFHKSILFIIPFGFIYSVKDNTKNKRTFFVYFIICLTITIINVFYRNIFSLFGGLINLINNEGMENSISFYSATTTRLGFLFYYLYYIYNLTSMHYIKKMYVSNFSDCDNSVLYRFINCGYYKNIFTLIYLPFITFNTTFFRFILFDCNIVFIALCGLIYYLNRKRKGGEKIINMNYLYIIAVMMFLFTIEWWYLKVNVLSLYEALKCNIFF